MKTRIVAVLGAVALLFLTGCNLIAYKAAEVHQTISYPLIFTDSIDAIGIKKVTREDGTVIRKAETLTHSLTVFGFARTATYKEAEIETNEAKK